MSDTLTVRVFPDADSINDNDATVFADVDFVSLVNHGTFGPPALVAPGRSADAPRAQRGDKVLYVNTSVVALFEIVRDE